MRWSAWSLRAVRPVLGGVSPKPVGLLPDPAGIPAEDDRLRPLYARVLGLGHVDPGGILCFVFFEGALILGFLLALAELISLWGILILPASVAVMVKVNDLVAASVARSAARVPELEQERFRREMQPVVGRAAVPRTAVPRAPATRRRIEPNRSPSDIGRDPGSTTVGQVRPELATPRTRPRPIAGAVRPEVGQPGAEPGSGPG